MLSDDNSFTSDLIGKAADYVLKAATDYPLIAVGTAIAGTAGYYVLRCLKNKSNTDKLMVAIKEKDVTLAKQLISTMSPDELNKTNTSKSTPLYTALNNSREIAKLIIDKFLASDTTLNYQLPNGKSILKHKKHGHRLLSIVNIDFKHFACSDVKRFVLNIKDKAKAHEITNRVTKDGPAELQANLIQPMHGKFTRMAIAHCAKLINQSQSGVCTTLALAGADRLLKLFPNERIEIIAHEGGYQGTHVYIIMNHTGDSWKMNNLQAMRESGTDKAQASDELTKVFLQETDHAFIVDPWLASLGWDAGVFDILVFLNDKRLSNFLTSTVCFFDSNNEPKPKNRLV